MAIGLYYATRNILILLCAALLFIICDKLRFFYLTKHNKPVNDPVFNNSGASTFRKGHRQEVVKMKSRMYYTHFAIHCLIIGLILFGTFCFYYTVASFNERLSDLEQTNQDLIARTNFLEYRTSNCYPND